MATKWKRYYYCFHFAIIFKDNGSWEEFFFPFTKKGPGVCAPPGRPFPGLSCRFLPVPSANHRS